MEQNAERPAAPQAAGGSGAAPKVAGAKGVAADEESARRWLILGVVCLGQLMVVLDATVVNIALPHGSDDLAFSNADRQWVVTAYSLAFGGLLLLGGRLSDLVGRKRMLIIGMVGFAAASALGGAATGFGMLLVGRAIQGAFGAMLAPARAVHADRDLHQPGRTRARPSGSSGPSRGRAVPSGCCLAAC